MLRIIAVIWLILCWIAWALAFVRARNAAAGQQKVVRAPASRWGIVLEGIGFALATVQIHPVDLHKSWPAPIVSMLIASMLLGPLSAALAWAATRHLGKQWRYEAALSADHDLIQTGPYARIRHPIYTSMFGMLLAAGLALGWWPLFLAGICFFIAGTEVRIRAEERLLAERFQDSFAAYRARVPAYIPFLR